ncbi:MAG: prephenate dehydrogenase/arogenate dehydrogenase family protein [Promethearchaeota archaeon]
MLGRNLTIIGGSGGMGQVFARYFKNHGFNITLQDTNTENLKLIAKDLGVKYEFKLEKSLINADIVMISIPIHSTPEMIKKVAPYLKQDTILFDIASIKGEVFRVLNLVQKEFPINCLTIHPMFGPGIKNFQNYIIIVVRVGGTNKYKQFIEEFLNIFKSDGVFITETTSEMHDKHIALTLGIPHMFNILFLSLLKDSKESLPELTRYTGTTFLLQKILAESIIHREMEMFGEIQIENHEFLEVLEKFEDLIQRYKKMIKEKDLDGFKKLFIELLNYSKEDNHFTDSYEYFYKFLKILKEKKE